MKMNQFEKGREYERLYDSMRLHLVFGYGCIFGSMLFLVGYIFNIFIQDYVNAVCYLLLLFFGFFSLYLGYSEKKELKDE